MPLWLIFVAVTTSLIVTVGYASKITGKLSFAGSAMVGRLGRAYLYVLYKYAASGGHRYRHSTAKLTQQLTHALEWWRVALSDAPARTFTLYDNRPVWELYTDAALVPHGLGAVLAASERGTPQFPSGPQTQAFGVYDLDSLSAWLPPSPRSAVMSPWSSRNRLPICRDRPV